MKSTTIREIVLSPRWIQGQYNYMSLETAEKIDGKVVAVPPITVDFIQRFETLGKTQQQPFRASQMLQYEWRSGHAIAAKDANFDVTEDNKDLLVLEPV